MPLPTAATAARVPARRSLGRVPVRAPMKSLREMASSIGQAVGVEVGQVAQDLDGLGRGLGEVGPGVGHDRLGVRRRRPSASATLAARKRRTSSTTSP